MTAVGLRDLAHDSGAYSPRAQITSRLRHVYMGPASFPGAVLSCPPTEVRCMSSLDHDHPLDEAPAPRTRAGSPPAPARRTRSRRRPAVRTGDKATTSAPVKATVAKGAGTAGKAAPTAGTKAAGAKAATTKPATTKAATTKAAAAKAATTKAAVTPPAPDAPPPAPRP